ncbi:carbon-nitrogen hydrolase family protein [Ktedonosporobacter rubrisoli]|uniref:Carbon-nitrogen hydrolase family protein n=1 Tax=Ktedonosporobacter rubrisoli TaxID=2509675 RepID=A0A4P6JIX7_KTERU|nr:carbon-nitrogen hydrolase family protein [Ktedonosporobacter rubrisoli]QBD75044.1 carbon-nitrogen hydrolase family protein [Ktedonosporobacter rubrisoli]
MRITIAQMCPERDIAHNKQKILSLLKSSLPDEWVAFPEGALSGYFPEEEAFLSAIDPREIEEAIEEIQQEVKRLRCHCLLGTALFTNRSWYNAALLQSYLGEYPAYRKIRLSVLDRKHFAPGSEVPVYTVDDVKLSMQICRELVFPEPWLALKRQDVQIIFHINNAIKPYDQVWEHLLIARAVENRVFVCSVNNSAPPQKLTSYLISPQGEVLLRAQERTEQRLSCEIDLREVKPLSC